MRRGLIILCVMTLSAAAWAQKKSGGEDSTLKLVPLVDMQAPLVAVWFVAAPRIPFENAAAVEEQIYEDFFKRMDIRMLSREKTLEKLGDKESGLRACDGSDPCLFRIGQVLGVDRMVGVIMVGSSGNYKIILKSFDLESRKPRQLNAVVEGSLTDLLIGGTADAVASVFENRDQYAPVDVAALRPPENNRPRAAPSREEPPRSAADRKKPSTAGNTGLAAPAPERPGFFRRHLWSTVAAGASVAILATAIGFGAASKSIESNWEDGIVWDSDLNQRGADYALAANILFGFSGAAAVTAVVLFFVVEKDPDPALSVYPSPTGIEALVRF